MIMNNFPNDLYNKKEHLENYFSYLFIQAYDFINKLKNLMLVLFSKKGVINWVNKN